MEAAVENECLSARVIVLVYSWCSSMVVYLREPHEFVDVLRQEYHVAVGRHHGDEALQRLQVQTVHLSVLVAIAAATATAWREGQRTRWVTQIASPIPC